MTVFSFVLVFCAGMCTGFSGLAWYVHRLEQEVENAETRKS